MSKHINIVFLDRAGERYLEKRPVKAINLAVGDCDVRFALQLCGYGQGHRSHPLRERDQGWLAERGALCRESRRPRRPWRKDLEPGHGGDDDR